MNEPAKKNDLLMRIVPPFAAILLIVIFALLGNWQLDRAIEKVATVDMFAAESAYIQVTGTAEMERFQQIEVRGNYLPQQQVLIDNIVRKSAVGYYVVTALEFDANQPLLIVNRGWIHKPRDTRAFADISVADDLRTLKGRAGRLPRVAIRSGDAFAEENGAWPRVAVYPTLDDVSAQLGRDVLPYALLLDADQPEGYLREWMPKQSGPMTHYGYAFQWFAMSLTVVGISIWQFRKKWRARG